MTSAYIILYQRNTVESPDGCQILVGYKQVINYRSISRTGLKYRENPEQLNYKGDISTRMHDKENCMACLKSGRGEKKFNGILSPQGGLPCFPGGGEENDDKNCLQNTALREFIEEVGLVSEDFSKERLIRELGEHLEEALDYFHYPLNLDTLSEEIRTHILDSIKRENISIKKFEEAFLRENVDNNKLNSLWNNPDSYYEIAFNSSGDPDLKFKKESPPEMHLLAWENAYSSDIWDPYQMEAYIKRELKIIIPFLKEKFLIKLEDSSLIKHLVLHALNQDIGWHKDALKKFISRPTPPASQHAAAKIK